MLAPSDDRGVGAFAQVLQDGAFEGHTQLEAAHDPQESTASLSALQKEDVGAQLSRGNRTTHPDEA
jgi:hypothetical protein